MKPLKLYAADVCHHNVLLVQTQQGRRPHAKLLCRCETDLQTSDQHCGACGNDCGCAKRCEEGDCVCDTPSELHTICCSSFVGNVQDSWAAWSTRVRLRLGRKPSWDGAHGPVTAEALRFVQLFHTLISHCADYGNCNEDATLCFDLSLDAHCGPDCEECDKGRQCQWDGATQQWGCACPDGEQTPQSVHSLSSAPPQQRTALALHSALTAEHVLHPRVNAEVETRHCLVHDSTRKL